MTTKLQRSIHNQLDVSTSPLHVRKTSDPGGGAGASDDLSKNLILRKYDLLQPQILKDVLTRCRPHLRRISKLDISFSIADFGVLNLLCASLDNLRTLHAKSCGLSDALTPVSWPRRLQDLDLSRNELRACPQGVCELLHLSKLNLSGNRIELIPPAVLQIPCLKKCLLLNNPIRNIPKDVCREGVEQMRQYLAVEPHPLPAQDVQGQQMSRSGGGRRRNSASVSSLENCSDLRRFVLRSQGSSFESDYDSSVRCHSPLSTDSLSSISTDVEFSECSDVELDSSFCNTEWREFDTTEIPANYVGTKNSPLCQVYLPDDCTAKIEIEEVKDLSLHPTLKDNQLLITPVVSITPHGLNFGSNPAILVLSHCTKRNRAQDMDLMPICSSTNQHQAPEWVVIDDSECEIFAECVMFEVSHFSLFAVVATFPYPSLSVDVRPGVGGALLIPELPGFSLHIPNESVQSLKDKVSVKVTVFYCDQPYRVSHNNSAPASACIGMEPHGMEFDSPVEIAIPIPDCTTIVSQFPEARLELWCSREAGPDGSTPCNWQLVEGTDFHLQRNEECDSHVLQFTTSHFSWYELLWSLCTAPLQQLRLGATVAYDQLRGRAKYVGVRFQAFMSHPHGNSHTFGLAVTVYKFGDPLLAPSNYPLLVADSGIKRMFLRIGELHVRVEGCFVASQDVGEDLERAGRILDFAGEDFCERFEFVLSLKSEVAVPLQEGLVLGKLRFIQWDHQSHPIHKPYNLIVVRPKNIYFLRVIIN